MKDRCLDRLLAEQHEIGLLNGIIKWKIIAWNNQLLL